MYSFSAAGAAASSAGAAASSTGAAASSTGAAASSAGAQAANIALIVNKPKIVFADEPTGNLDTKTTMEIMDLITGMAYEDKQTLIIVTHDNEISDYVNRVVYLRDGQVERIEENNNVLKGATN